MDDTHIEQDLGCVGDLVEIREGFVELVVVVTAEGRDPCLNFLQKARVNSLCMEV